MRIGIVGNYGNDNQGDESILEGIITQLENTFPIERKDIIVFTNNREQTKQRYKTDVAPLFVDRKTDAMKFIATILHHRQFFASLDLLIIGGGGILMDLYKNNPFVYGMYGLLVRMTKIPAVIFGAGVGPINTFIGKKFIKMTVSSTKAIMVRDEESKQVLRDIGVKEPINIIMDPAFYLPFTEKQQKNERPRKIGVTAITYFHDRYWPVHDKEKYEAYVQGMAKNLDSILEQEREAEIEFFSTKHPHDTETTKDIQNLMKHKNRTLVHDRLLTHQEIIQLSAKMDLVIGTRLHSLIMAIVAKTPIIGVGYHDKVIDVMTTVNCRENTVTIEQVSEDDQCMLPIYEAMTADWDDTLTKFNELSEQIIENSPDGMEEIKNSVLKL